MIGSIVVNVVLGLVLVFLVLKLAEEQDQYRQRTVLCALIAMLVFAVILNLRTLIS